MVTHRQVIVIHFLLSTITQATRSESLMLFAVQLNTTKHPQLLELFRQ